MCLFSCVSSVVEADVSRYTFCASLLRLISCRSRHFKVYILCVSSPASVQLSKQNFKVYILGVSPAFVKRRGSRHCKVCHLCVSLLRLFCVSNVKKIMMNIVCLSCVCFVCRSRLFEVFLLCASPAFGKSRRSRLLKGYLLCLSLSCLFFFFFFRSRQRPWIGEADWPPAAATVDVIGRVSALHSS